MIFNEISSFFTDIIIFFWKNIWCVRALQTCTIVLAGGGKLEVVAAPGGMN